MSGISNTEQTVASFIRSHGLMNSHDLYVVAVSGGADSVALLLMLFRLGFRVHAAHCNFKLRGEESDRDELFVRRLAERLGIPLHVAHFATRDYAALHHESIETAARHLRYDYFEQLRRDIGATAIAVAHHRDDQVETVLMHLVRGCGLKGLAGIHAVNGRIIRPLLCIARKDIEGYLKSLQQDYVTDSTNLDIDEATRNLFRLKVIPLLCQVNPQAVSSIDTMSRHIKEVETLVDWTVELVRSKGMTVLDDDGAWRLSLSALTSVPTPRLVLAELLMPLGFTSSQVEDIHQAVVAGRSGRRFFVIYRDREYCLLVDRDCLEFSPVTPEFRPMTLPECGTYVLSDDRRLRMDVMETDADGFTISKDPSCITADYDRVSFPLRIRTVQTGDRFRPFGMKGSKLVSDFLTDAKMTLNEKRAQLVVEDSRGEILWVVGRRTSQTCRITDESRRALVMRVGK